MRYGCVIPSVLSASMVKKIRQQICHNRDYLPTLWSRYRPWPSRTGSMPCHCLLPVSRWIIKFDTDVLLTWTALNECQRYSEDPSAYLFVANIHLSLQRRSGVTPDPQCFISPVNQGIQVDVLAEFFHLVTTVEYCDMIVPEDLTMPPPYGKLFLGCCSVESSF